VLALVLAGPPGSGKSHLASVWRARAQGGLVDGPSLTVDSFTGLLDGPASLVVEAADAAPDEALLHLHNAWMERRGSLLLIARAAPAYWGKTLPDLTSRLATLPVAWIDPPDDELILAVLVKLFADRQLRVPIEVVEYLATRMERSFEAARDLVASIDKNALETGRRITPRLVREILTKNQSGQPKSTSASGASPSIAHESASSSKTAQAAVGNRSASAG
jgi:chromosomal replication initiation ATPase DnaA